MEIIKKFNDRCRLFIKDKIAEEKKIQSPKEKKIFKQKYPFLGRKYKLPFYYELINDDTIKTDFSSNELNQITIHLINKIRGIYKHAQAEKTMLCNIDIISSIKLNRFTICITKNTLEANSQWFERLIKDLKKEFPNRSLKELILICSSKNNTLGNNATHCGNIHLVISNLLRYNTFRVLFICSNHTRVEEILTLLESYSGLNEDKQLPINLQYDEAHNIEEGIPSKRFIIENIIMNPIIERFTPCSASENPIHDNNNPLWLKVNLDRNAFDYTRISAIKSDSPEYSSLHDAVCINFEDIETHPNYTDYNITAFDLLDFKRVDDTNNSASFIKKHQQIYSAEGYSDEQVEAIVDKLLKDDINRRRQLEFCSFFKGEKHGYNMALNILANYYDVPGTCDKIFKPNVKNIHIITTPIRVAFTYSLMKYAIQQPYTPILIGLYRGKINVMYKDNQNKTQEIEYADFSENGSDKELNEKIDKTLNYLSALNINVNVPVILMGNYKPTGESITFVNFKYGPLRSVVLIPSISSTPETDYQTFCRENYMLTKFIEHDPSFVCPEKIICSYKKNTDNALIIEKRNDDRIDEFKTNPDETSVVFVPVLHDRPVNETSNNENISIPVKIQIVDTEDDNVIALYDILKTKPKRNEEDNKKILKLLLLGSQSNAIVISDKTGKFDFERYKLKSVRTYVKKSESEIQKRKEKMGERYKSSESNYRFAQCDANYNQNKAYSFEGTEQMTCELYACKDRYVHDEFVNPKERMWLSYRF